MNFVKKLIMITGAILLIYLIVITAAAQPTENSSPQVTSAEADNAESGYRLGVSDGRVAVFRDGELYMRTDTQISSLPKADRKRLDEGINIDSVKELTELLQDFCS